MTVYEDRVHRQNSLQHLTSVSILNIGKVISLSMIMSAKYSTSACIFVSNKLETGYFFVICKAGGI